MLPRWRLGTCDGGQKKPGSSELHRPQVVAVRVLVHLHPHTARAHEQLMPKLILENGSQPCGAKTVENSRAILDRRTVAPLCGPARAPPLGRFAASPTVDGGRRAEYAVQVERNKRMRGGAGDHCRQTSRSRRSRREGGDGNIPD